MSGLQDLKPEQVAELELAMLEGRALINTMAACQAKPWPLRRVSYGDLPVSASAYYPSPWTRSFGRMAEKRARFELMMAERRRQIRQRRRDNWTIAACIAVLLGVPLWLLTW